MLNSLRIIQIICGTVTGSLFLTDRSVICIMSPRNKTQIATIRQEKRDLLLETALHLFANHGFHSTTISQIATAAGISKGLVYNYFESKEALLLAVFHDISEMVFERFAINPEQPLTDEDMERIIRISMDITLEQPERWKLYMAMAFQPQVTTLVFDHLMEEMKIYIQRLVAYFTTKGYSDPVAQMRYFSAVLDGLQMHLLLDPDNFPLEYTKEQLIQQFIRS